MHNMRGQGARKSNQDIPSPLALHILNEQGQIIGNTYNKGKKNVCND